jgi:hypothetical protein
VFRRVSRLLEAGRSKKISESAVNGTVRPVTSSIQLGAAISGARVDSLRSELSHMALLRFQAQRELSAFQQMPPPTLLTVTSGHALTATTLRNDVAPTIAGIESFGRAASLASLTEYRGSVSSISQDSPISINMTGLKDAVELVLSFVIPWRRENAKRLATLDVRERELAVERQEREQDRESSLHDLDLEKRRLENLRIELELAKSKFELEKSKFELAERILRERDPDAQLRGEAREHAMALLRSGIDQLSSTRLEFEVARDFPRQ